MIEHTLQGIRNALSSNTIEGFLYGSAKGSPMPGHDLDIVIVCQENDKSRVRCELAALQTSADVLIHAVLISPQELFDNRTFQTMLKEAKRLW